MIIAVNITLDIGLLIDEFRKFASETTQNNTRNSPWFGQWGGVCRARNGIWGAGQELPSEAIGRHSQGTLPPEPAGAP